MAHQDAATAFAEVDLLLERLADRQRAKVLAIARTIVPRLTDEDVMTPEAYPVLWSDGPFNYEDGILNGLLSAQMAVRAAARRG